MSEQPVSGLSDGITSHPQRCDNACPNKGCYFHPNMGTKKRGLDTDHPITIPEFIRRFGCAMYMRHVPSVSRNEEGELTLTFNHAALEQHDSAIIRKYIEIVIDKLEYRITHPATMGFEKHSHECDIINAVYRSAIALLQGVASSNNHWETCPTNPQRGGSGHCEHPMDDCAECLTRTSQICKKDPNHTIISATLVHLCAGCSHEQSCTASTSNKNPFKISCFGKIAICPRDDECPVAKYCQEYFDTICKNRDKASSETINKIREKLIHMNDETCVDKMNSAACHSYGDNCTLCKFDAVVQSLKKQQKEDRP